LTFTPAGKESILARGACGHARAVTFSAMTQKMPNEPDLANIKNEETKPLAEGKKCENKAICPTPGRSPLSRRGEIPNEPDL
jgi:hypothetical protein